jgi:hypothetical protein
MSDTVISVNSSYTEMLMNIKSELNAQAMEREAERDLAVRKWVKEDVDRKGNKAERIPLTVFGHTMRRNLEDHAFMKMAAKTGLSFDETPRKVILDKCRRAGQVPKGRTCG